MTTKVHKIEVLVFNFNDAPNGDVKYEFENNKYFCGKVLSMKTLEIPEWTDDHVLNQSDTPKEQIDKLFEGE